MRPQAELWAGNYVITQRGYPYPVALDLMSKLVVEVTYLNDASDSVLFLVPTPGGDKIMKLWVGACCLERREGDAGSRYPRFDLSLYTADVDDLPEKITEDDLAEWSADHDEGDIGWDPVFEGNDAGELIDRFAEVAERQPPQMRAAKSAKEYYAEKRRQAEHDSDYNYTHYGFKWPTELLDGDGATEVAHYDVTDRNDETDSVLLVTSDGDVFRLWVQPSCVEQRDDPNDPRFVLERYPRDLGWYIKSGKDVGPWMAEATGQWQEIWRGDDGDDLVFEFQNHIPY